MTDSCTPEQLQDLLREQLDLLTELIHFGGEQQEAIEAGRVSELLSILARKQPYLERLGEVRELLRDWRESIEGEHFWQASPLQGTCQRLRDQSASAFKTLIELEQACESALSASRDQIQIRLQRVDTGRTAANAYQSQAALSSVPRGDFSSMG